MGAGPTGIEVETPIKANGYDDLVKDKNQT